MKRFNIELLTVTALSLLAPASVRAGAFFIDDTLTTEQIRFSANDFEGGLFLNGVLFQQGLNNPASANFPEAAAGNPIIYNFQGSWITTGAPLPPTIQVAFIEPRTSLISDVLFCQYQDLGNGFGQITGHFVSDSTEQGLDPLQYLTPGVPVTNWPEQNGPFDFSAPFLSASANSDVEVPEPGAMSLCLIGILVGGGLKGRRQLCRNSAK